MIRDTGTVQPILITGGCGFLGCNLADRLAAAGIDVLILDNLSRQGVRENAHWLKSRHGDRIRIAVGDIRDPISVIDSVRDAQAVLHLAAQVAVTSSLQNPVDDFEINAGGTLNVLEAIRTHNPDAPLVFASTNKVYGHLISEAQIERHGMRYRPSGNAFPSGIDESTPLDFYSPYGCSKGTADQYVRDYSRVYGLRTAVLRMSCIYGPRQFGNEDQGWIAHFVRSALRGEPLTIYGEGYQVRDALFVSDAVDAWIAVLRNIESCRGRVFNLGGGASNSISLLELIEMITRLSQTKVQYDFAEWRPGDQPWYVSDVSALSSAIGWRPTTSLEDGLQLLQTWLQGQLRPSADAREALA
ncbi:MAG TPA: GDP-mannose 4,6-dehydratase [Bradyrhizobium sp.]|uniref:GDP-mannose 4,6-dehydratase n=1 Tax=Bradyrhizobium sp. TaxID=376 RepID=UPI002D808BDF|nr:GDP-mannose 4,6-dehydratase [Bradyrhizobium sp.]HET7889730.1 GDP-mannose 4,6-dehydratase [Bradyrhizobium sp.]